MVHTNLAVEEEIRLKNEKNLPKPIITKTFLQSLSDVKKEMTTHPSALKYVENYDANKFELAKILFKKYNAAIFENGLPCDMNLIWKERLLTTAGKCRCLKKSMYKCIFTYL